MSKFIADNKKELIIRIASNNDLPQVLQLMEQLGYPQILDELEKRFKIFMDQKDYGVAVAEKNNKVIGWVAWSKSIVFVVPQVRIRIEGLIVENKHRGQGIGKALMLYVEKMAESFSPCIIDLTSGVRRATDGSHDFYKSLGYYNEGHMAKLYLRKQI